MPGYAAPAVQADHRRAEVLATRLGARPEVLPSLIAIWAYWLVSGDLRHGARAHRAAHRHGPIEAFSLVRARGGGLRRLAGVLRRPPRAARAHLERAMAGFPARPPDQTVSPFWPLPNDPIAVSHIALACVSTAAGRAREAEQLGARGLPARRGDRLPAGSVQPRLRQDVRRLDPPLRRRRRGVPAAGRRGRRASAGSTAMRSGRARAPLRAAGTARRRRRTGRSSSRSSPRCGSWARSPSRPPTWATSAGSGCTPGASRAACPGVRREALEVVHKTGEDLHLPELLRQRARYPLARGADPATAVADLPEAVRIATRAGRPRGPAPRRRRARPPADGDRPATGAPCWREARA